MTCLSHSNPCLNYTRLNFRTINNQLFTNLSILMQIIQPMKCSRDLGYHPGSCNDFSQGMTGMALINRQMRLHNFLLKIVLFHINDLFTDKIEF